MAPGPQTIFITDGNGFTTTPIDFTVTEGDAINASLEAAASDLLVCDGLLDGSITITASGAVIVIEPVSYTHLTLPTKA